MNVKVDTSDNVPARFRALDSMVRRSFIVARNEGLILNPYIKDYYIWGSGSSGPLGQYLEYTWRGDTTTDMLKKWVSMGPIYSAYGSYLVRRHPFAYFNYFFAPNINNFFSPVVADLGYYNNGTNRLDQWVASWFDYKYLVMKHAPRNYELKSLWYYPMFMEIFNLSFLITCFLYWFWVDFKKVDRCFNQTVLLVGGFWLLNFCFSCAASSGELRYQVFQFVLCVCFTFIFIEQLWRRVISPKKINPLSNSGQWV